MKKEKKLAAQNTLPARERRSYFIGGFGQGAMYAVMSNYISDFYLNVMRLDARFVLLLTMLSRVWDSVNDPIMGVIMDRTQPKGGKMRPYLYVAPWPVAVLTIAMFIAPNYIFPNISMGFLMVYAAITYVLWDMVYTVGDIPFWALPNAMVADPAERGKLVAVSRTVNGIGSAIPLALFMIIGPLLSKAGFQEGIRLEQTRYLTIVLLVCGVGGFLYFQTALKVRERVPQPPPAQRSAGEPGGLSLILRNKPLMLVICMGILAAGRYMFSAAAVHVARYSVGIPGREIQSSISTVALIMQGAMGAGQLFAMILLPKLMDRFNYRNLLIGTGLLGGAAGLTIYFMGYNSSIYALIPLFFICSIPFGIINNLSYAMTCDTLDYMEWKTGFRANGLGQATQTFVNKLDNALATSAVILVYIVLGLDVNNLVASSDIGVSALNMPANIRGGFFSMISLVPAVSLLLCVIPMFFYDLHGEKKDQVTRELAERREKAGVVVSSADY